MHLVSSIDICTTAHLHLTMVIFRTSHDVEDECVYVRFKEVYDVPLSGCTCARHYHVLEKHKYAVRSRTTRCTSRDSVIEFIYKKGQAKLNNIK